MSKMWVSHMQLELCHAAQIRPRMFRYQRERATWLYYAESGPNVNKHAKERNENDRDRY